MATAGASKTSALAAARQRARERRVELDRDRDEADRKVEEATASALVALDARGAAAAALEIAEQKVGSCLRGLLACPGVSLDRAAALTDLGGTEVRRLLKATGTDVDVAAQDERGPGSARPDAAVA